jgi:hypothetical protein
MEHPVQTTGEANVRVEAEGVFPGGFWIRGGLGHNDVADTTGAATWKSSAWSSSLDLGVGKRTVLGLGVSWDWKRTELDPADPLDQPADAERELALRLHLGGIDTDRRRVNWMISLGYTVPTVPAGEIVVPYHLNASLSAYAKAGDILILKVAARSKAYQSAALAEGVAFASAFSYRFDWNAGLGLRLPPPFILGISYGGQITAGLGPRGLADTDPYVGGWTLSLGYVF